MEKNSSSCFRQVLPFFREQPNPQPQTTRITAEFPRESRRIDSPGNFPGKSQGTNFAISKPRQDDVKDLEVEMKLDVAMENLGLARLPSLKLTTVRP